MKDSRKSVKYKRGDIKEMTKFVTWYTTNKLVWEQTNVVEYGREVCVERKPLFENCSLGPSKHEIAMTDLTYWDLILRTFKD